MGNKLFGVDISGELNKALGPGLLPCTLSKTTEGNRESTALTAGRAKMPKDYACRGYLDSFSQDAIDGTRILHGDKKGVILGDSLPSGIIPAVGDTFTVEGTEHQVIMILERDPAAATYTLQVRG